MSSIADSLTSPFNFLMSWLNLSFPRPIDQKLFQTMDKLTEGISAKDVFRGAETLFAQGADPNAVGTDVNTGKSGLYACRPFVWTKRLAQLFNGQTSRVFCLTRI